MRYSFFIFLLVCGVGAKAQIVNIPDANFKNALVNEMVADTNGDGAIDGPVDTNNDGEIQETEAEAVYWLKVDDFNIGSLEGIQSFTNLRELECSNNNISSLNLSQNSNLKVLSCIINQLSSLDVSQLTNLERLACAGNNIASLNVTQNQNLLRLICFNNQLITLDITQNPLLKSLDASYNPLIALDVSQNSNIETLFCGGTNLVSLDVSQNPKLENFNFGGSNLTSIDVTNNPDLRWLHCEENQLATLDLSQNSNLERLFCYSNQLTSLNLKNGNNLNLNMMLAYDNPGLTCIEVDNESHANAQTCYPGNWCKGENTTYSENCTIGTEDFEFKAASIYPNPVSKILNINTEKVIERIQIFSISGSMIKEVFDSKIDVSQLQEGIYFTKIFSQGKSYTKKFIKN